LSIKNSTVPVVVYPQDLARAIDYAPILALVTSSIAGDGASSMTF